jgi:hypothetical protein
MPVKVQVATVNDVADLVALQTAVNQRLATLYGNGYWVATSTEKRARFMM